jgi:hypothetical protein
MLVLLCSYRYKASRKMRVVETLDKNDEERVKVGDEVVKSL